MIHRFGVIRCKSCDGFGLNKMIFLKISHMEIQRELKSYVKLNTDSLKGLLPGACLSASSHFLLSFK